MAGVREDEHLVLEVEHPVEGGDELVAVGALVEQRVHLAHDRADRELVADLGQQAHAETRHDERGRDPLARHVRDREPHPGLGDRHEIVVVAPHLVVRPRLARDVEARDLGRALGQERELDLARDRELLLEPPALEQLARQPRALDRHRRLGREHREQGEVPVVVGVVLVALEVEHSDGAPLEQQRRGDLAAGRGSRGDIARIARHVGHDHRLAGLRHPADDPLADLEVEGALGALGVTDLGHQLERQRVAVDQVDRRRVEVHHLTQGPEHGLDHLVQVERRRQGLRDLEQHVLLERPALGLVVEQRVVEREGDVLGGELEAVEVGVGEGAARALVEALDRPQHLAAPEQRHHQRAAERRDFALERGPRILGREPQRLLPRHRPAGQPLAARDPVLAGRRGGVLGEIARHQAPAVSARDPDARGLAVHQPAAVVARQPQQVVEVGGPTESGGREGVEVLVRREGRVRRRGGLLARGVGHDRVGHGRRTLARASQALQNGLNRGSAGSDNRDADPRQFSNLEPACPRNTSVSASSCSSRN